MTWFWWGQHLRQKTNARIISKRDAGSNFYEIYTTATNLSWRIDAVIRNRAVSLVGSRSVALTLKDGEIPKVYVDGVLDGPMTATLSLGSGSADLNIGGYWQALEYSWDNPLDGVIGYSAELSADEVGKLDAYCNGLITPRKQWPGGGLTTGDPKYVDNIQSARVSLVNETSGNLSNTEIGIVSGTWKITESAAGRTITCVANGQLKRYLVGASGFTTQKFEQTGGVVLTKNAADFTLDATAGDTITALVLTAP
jgi:hypothetical protein